LNPPYAGRAFGSIMSILWYDILAPFLILILFQRVRSYKIIHAAFPEQGIWFPLIKAKKIVTVHDLNPFIDKGSSLIQILWNLYARLVYYISIRFADHIISVSSQTKRELKSILNVSNNRITIVNPGVSGMYKMSPKKENHEPIIGFVGKLTERKRVTFLLATLKALNFLDAKRKWKLFIHCSDGFNMKKFKSLSEVFMLQERIQFNTYVPEEKMSQIYKCFDILIFPSSHEGFGFPILEAQRCGIPVITMVGAKIPEETSCYTLKAQDPEDIARICIQLIQDQDLYEKTSKAGYFHASKFTWDKCAKRIIELYRRLLKNVP